MIPAAVVEGDERHAGLDQSPGQEGSLAEAIAAVAVADRVGFAMDVERRLGFWRSDEVVALLVELVERQHRVAGGRVVDAQQAIDFLRADSGDPELSPVKPAGKATSRTRKLLRLGSSATTNGAYFAPRKFGPPERDMRGIEK